jgi:hypothetical protein
MENKRFIVTGKLHVAFNSMVMTDKWEAHESVRTDSEHKPMFMEL